MNEPLDELYLTWLYKQIGSVKIRRSSRTYWSLFRQLYTKEFDCFVPNDDNRAEDGKELRYEFIDDQGLEDIDPEWMSLKCSMLELLIGLSRRLSFETDRDPKNWFWELLENIKLDSYNDRQHIPHKEVDEILERVIWRTYDRNGHGGLFPLKRASKDQRKVELWYQMSAYLIENRYVA